MLSPIAIFAYKRPKHLLATLKALNSCPEFSHSQVFINIDGARDESEIALVQAAQRIAEDFQHPNKTLNFQQTNRGLARSIIAGVTNIVERYGRVIVIEDDLVLQPSSLAWLNAGLNTYANDDRVMQISAYQYRVPEFARRQEGSFQRFATTWGWGTWKRAWDKFDERATGWEAVRDDMEVRTAFDGGGVYPFSAILERQMAGKVDSWGIRWSWSVFRNNGLTLMPPRSLVKNTGMDASGTHNSIGILKQFVSGPAPLLWSAAEPPALPSHVALSRDDERAFRQGLRRTNAIRNARIKAALARVGMSHFAAEPLAARPHVFAVAQLPPPVTGLSAVNARMIREFAAADLLLATADIAPPRGWPSALKPAGRLAKVIWSTLRLVVARAQGALTLYMPCDGRSGLTFNVLLAAVARVLGYSLWTHHHSFAYLNQRSALMAAFLRASPKGTTHLLLCDRMETLLLERYPSEWPACGAKMIVLSNAFMSDATSAAPATDGGLVLGHLSNLTEDKGALRFLQLFARLRRRGLAVRAKIAGPANEPQVKAAIEATAAEFPDAFHWLGPVYGSDKDAFYEGVDVFVFPSSYANEAQPLVLLEALAHGAAVVTTDRGCMGCDHQGSPGAIFPENDFDTQAERWIENLAANFNRASLTQDATLRFASLKYEADRALARVIAEI